jgi:5'-nucleotidase
LNPIWGTGVVKLGGRMFGSLGRRAAVAVVAALALSSTTVTPAKAAPSGAVEIQVLAITDFHGHLDPPSGSEGEIAGVAAGGVEYLATHVRQLEANRRNSIVVSSGDLIGGSPMLSGLFHDEPTIEAMNLVGLDLNGVGNHEFDEGVAELRRMQEGGCHPVDGCLDGDGFAGASFRFLAANVMRADGATLFPPYHVRTFQDAKVGFIGVTLEGTPEVVMPSAVAGLTFRDEAETVNALVPELQRKGIEAIVLLVHQGGAHSGGYNDCQGLAGPIVEIVARLHDAVDVVMTGHSHQAYNCVIDGKLVTSAGSDGRLVTDVDLSVDKRSGQVLTASANNVIVTRSVPKATDVSSLLSKYRSLSGSLESRAVGTIAADITRVETPAGESALGDVIADAQLAATDGPGEGQSVAAFTNPGGIRADLLHAPSGHEQPGVVTYGEAFAVQPFGNSLVTMALSGAQLDSLLEQQWCGQSAQRILQVSAGFTYTWDATKPVCDRVDPATIKIGGVPVDPMRTYRVTVNGFLADGGDRFTVLTQGSNRLGGPIDVDALTAHLAANSPVAPGPRTRIARLG